jgi:hypothetical protein
MQILFGFGNFFDILVKIKMIRGHNEDARIRYMAEQKWPTFKNKDGRPKMWW